MKNYADLRGCYEQGQNFLFNLRNSSHPVQAHSNNQFFLLLSIYIGLISTSELSFPMNMITTKWTNINNSQYKIK